MTNLESAKYQMSVHAETMGILLPADGFINRMLELSAQDTLPFITHRNYLATVRRGLITPETTVYEFLMKIKEESHELYDSWMKESNRFDSSELADIALVCFAMAEHYGIDLIDEMRKKTEFNEKRKD